MFKQTHTLKVLKPYFLAIDCGDKKFDARRDDRGYQKGDLLVLKEWEPPPSDKVTGRFTGNEIERTIKYILTGGQFGIEPGFVVLGF